LKIKNQITKNLGTKTQPDSRFPALCHDHRRTRNSGELFQTSAGGENLKQRALDVALKEINKHSDIQLELEFVGRGAFRKVLSLGFRITTRKPRPNRGQARSSAIA
jgi:Initiator Replication protein